jgi:hypothetical protein
LRLACAASGTSGLERTGVGHTCIAAGETALGMSGCILSTTHA